MSKTTPIGAKMLPWSITRLKDFERCPRYAYESHVLKNKGPQSPYAARGETIHRLAETYVKSTKGRPAMPDELKNHAAGFKLLRKEPLVETERRFGLTATWEVTDFFGRDTWARGVYDVVVLSADGVRVIDHKTGKRYDEHVEQLKFYSIAALAMQPRAPKAIAEAWYLDRPQEQLRFELTRDDALRIRADFDERVGRMASSRAFPARPNARCRWCHINKANGGDCEAGA